MLNLAKMTPQERDKVISRLPEPLFSLAIMKFMPKLWKLLDTVEMAKNDSQTLMTWQGLDIL